MLVFRNVSFSTILWTKIIEKTNGKFIDNENNCYLQPLVTWKGHTK